MKHVVFVDSTTSGLLAFDAAKRLDCYVTYIHPTNASFLGSTYKKDISTLSKHKSIDQFKIVSSLDSPELHDILVEVNERRSIDAIISTAENAIIPVSKEAEFFGTSYPSYDSLTNAVFKDKCRSVLAEKSIRSPKFQVIEEEVLLSSGATNIDIPLPYVIKPTRGFGKLFSAICKSENDVREFIDNLISSRSQNSEFDAMVSNDFIIEEYICGTMHSVETVVVDGKVNAYATTIRYRSQYNEMLEMTATMPSGLTDSQNDELKEYVQKVFAALKLNNGLYHVELLRDESGPCLVEINARMMGSVAPQMYYLLTNIDPYELLVRVHLGEDFSVDDSKLVTGGSVVTVGAVEAGTISQDYKSSDLSSLMKKYGMTFTNITLQPGQNVRKYEGNLSALGHVIAHGETSLAAAKSGHEFLGEYEGMLGIKLARYF